MSGADANDDEPRFVRLDPEGVAAYELFLPHPSSDHLERLIASTGAPYEEGMLRAMARGLAAGDLVLDVGANIGNHTAYMAATGARVLAVEPNPELVRAVRRTVDRNGWGARVTVVEAAVSSHDGRGTLVADKPGNIGAQHMLLDEEGDTRVATLDQLVAEARTADARSVAVLKIDIEGMELAALEGATALLRTDRPSVFVECQHLSDFRRVAELLSAEGYVYVDTFNATPTHLFAHPGHGRGSVPNELVTHHYQTLVRLRKLRAENSRLHQANEALGNAAESERRQRERLDADLGEAFALLREKRAQLSALERRPADPGPEGDEPS